MTERKTRTTTVPAHARLNKLPSLGDLPVRAAHPGRTKDDDDRQVSWLAGFHPLRIAFPDFHPVAL